MYEFLVMVEVRTGKGVEIFYRKIYAACIAEAKSIANNRYLRTYTRGGKTIFSSSVLALYLNVNRIKEDDGNV